MFKCARITAFLAAVVVSLSGLVAISAPANASDDETYTKPQAARVYAAQMCRLNRRNAKFEKVVWRGQRTVYRDQFESRLRPIRNSAKKSEAVYYDVVRTLRNQPKRWPSAARRPIARMETSILRQQKDLFLLAYVVPRRQAWLRFTKWVDHRDQGFRQSVRVRTRLNMGRSSC